MRGREKQGCMVEWAYVFGFLLAKEVKTHFSKMGALPNSNFSHTLPIPCNNYLNQILAEINGWGKRQEWVVDSFDGFSPMAQG